MPTTRTGTRATGKAKVNKPALASKTTNKTSNKTSKKAEKRSEGTRSSQGQQLRLLSKQLKRASAASGAAAVVSPKKPEKSKRGKSKSVRLANKKKSREVIIADNLAYLRCLS